MTHKSVRKGSKPSRRPKGRDPNYLPDHVAKSFQVELVSLIRGLAADYGFKGSYLLSELLSKYNDPDGVTPEQRRSAAIEKWLSTERRNSVTNRRLLLADEDFGWTDSHALIRQARGIIQSVLGPLDYPNIVCMGSHTNGASTRVRRGPVAAVTKHTGEAHVSSSAVKHWLQVATNTRLADQALRIQESSVLFTVPKKTEIDRVACKEPEVNMFLQRSVGAHIRRRLCRFGVDLNDQTINQELARQALQLDLATIDLSAASDSITKQLVFQLLPFDWWSLLDDIRVKSTVIDGESHELEMFSSMGNGFTFELESLIFWALTRSICRLSGVKGKISVYGDDIICPRRIAPRLARTFAWFGFTVNPKKSNWTGSFRESCGKHYHHGLDVTPFYLREPVREKTDIIRLLNRLLEWEARGLGFITDERVFDFHYKWAKVIPSSLHGGQDPDDITSLVTGDSPRQRMRWRVKSLTTDETARLSLWLTQRRLTGENPLSVTPSKEGRAFLADQPSWTERTAWQPYLVWL